MGFYPADIDYHPSSLDRFHFDSLHYITKAGTWVWLGVFVSVPIAMGILWAVQTRPPGVDPPHNAPLPVWLRTALLVQGAVRFLFGGVMPLLPEMRIPLWLWKLSVLTSQAIGAWGVGTGIIAVQASWENGRELLPPFLVSHTLYGILHAINLVRHPATLDWSRFSAVAYTISIVSVLLAEAYGIWTVWRMKHDRASS